MPKNMERKKRVSERCLSVFCFVVIFRTTILCLNTFLDCVHCSVGKAVLWSTAEQQCVKCHGLIWICPGMWEGTEVLNPVKTDAKRGALLVPCISKIKMVITALFFFRCMWAQNVSTFTVVTFWVFKFIRASTYLFVFDLIQAQLTPYFLSTVLAHYMEAYWVKLLSNWKHHLYGAVCMVAEICIEIISTQI